MASASTACKRSSASCLAACENNTENKSKTEKKTLPVAVLPMAHQESISNTYVSWTSTSLEHFMKYSMQQRQGSPLWG